jgi:predicted nuclease of predicted toxin-antitoxin system
VKFLADQDVFAITIRALENLKHDVATARALGMARAPDSDLLRVAHEQGRILLTRDRDFGGLVFRRGEAPGVIYLWMQPPTQEAAHAELERVLDLYDERELDHAFVVVEPGRHRIRRLG